MSATVADFAAARRKMVDCQVRPSDVTDLRVVDAMLAVPRETFLPDEQRGLAYLDMEVPIGATERRRFLLKPAVIGRLLQAAGIAPNHKVLVVGGGTGYLAAIVSHLAGVVMMLENDSDFAAAAQSRFAMGGYPNVTVVSTSLLEGSVPNAPFDVVILDGSAEAVPDFLCRQLSANGCLVGVFGDRVQRAMIVRRSPKDFGSRVLFDASAPKLPDLEQPRPFVF